MKDIKINNLEYTFSRGKAKKEIIIDLLKKAGLSEMKGKLFALSIKDPFYLLCLIEVVREGNGSLLLIHSDTPRESCVELAKTGGCHYLLYNEEIIILEGKRLYEESSLTQFSSGTTGKPKKIIRSWQNISLEIDNYNQILGSEIDEVPVILVPPSHSYGLIAGILSAFKRGVTPHLVTNINPKYFLKIISSYKKPLVYGVPFQFNLINSIAPNFVFYKLISSGAPLNEILFESLKKNGSRVMQQYGCTECGCISIARKPESVSDNGIVLAHLEVETSHNKHEPSEIIIINDHSRICARDIGYVTPTGALHVLNRIDDLINISGQKVTPFEVEEVLSRIEGVEEAVVYRSAHKVWGDCVAALIRGNEKLEPLEIKSYCRKHLAAYKVPAKIKIVDEIPKTQQGKISRNLLIKLEENNGKN